MLLKIKTLWATCMTDRRIRFTMATLLALGAAFIATLLGEVVLSRFDIAVFLTLALINTWLIWTGRFFKKPVSQKIRR